MQWEELGLEMDCPQCDGTKLAVTQDIMTGLLVRIACTKCNATGKVPSANGEQLLEFMIKHLDLNTTFAPWGIVRK